MIGRSLCHYEVLDPLGKGGMGEVYRARDSKLDRDVAIKLLPLHLTENKERLARFEREAKVLASLNHPNIAAIYGLEESEGVPFLVMELVDGETLAERIAKGPVELEETLHIARQIAEGLEAAHESGIIHRDLKPANVKVTPEGRVKVLDFGLARTYGPEGSEELADSPTITVEYTRPGTLLGTAAYMSPEQARGKAVDKRADIWAFGCVLYEMLSGKRAFEGETISDTVAAILKDEPDWGRLPAGTLPRLKTLLQRCLEKDPGRRVRDIGDVRLIMEGAFETPHYSTRLAGAVALQFWQRPGPLAVGILVLVATAVLITDALTSSVEEAPVVRFDIPAPNLARPSYGTRAVLALAPNGDLAFAGEDGLYLRELGTEIPRRIHDTDGGRNPFFSPDGEFVGFWADGELRRVRSKGGGDSRWICNTVQPQGVTWGTDGYIYFAIGPEGIRSVLDDGGQPELVVTNGDGAWVSRPQLLLNGERWLLYTLSPTGFGGDAQIVVKRLVGDDAPRTLVRGTDGQYVPSGHLAYFVDGALMAATFDLNSMDLGERRSQIREEPAGYLGQYEFSQSGSLAFATAHRSLRLVWVDADTGEPTPLPPPAGQYSEIRLSPDGSRVAYELNDDRGWNIWVHEFATEANYRLTTTGDNHWPVWSPDGTHMYFTSDRNGTRAVWKQPVDTREDPTVVWSKGVDSTRSITEDGKLMLVRGIPGNWDLAYISEDGGDWKDHTILDTPESEGQHRVTADGEHIVFLLQGEAFVRNLSTGLQWPVPDARIPTWSKDETKIYCKHENRMFQVEVTWEPNFKLGERTPLFEYPEGSSPYYAVDDDGKRILMAWPVDQIDEDAVPDIPRINIVLNWFKELKETLPR